MEQAIILLLIILYAGTVVYLDRSHAKERDALTKKIMARNYNEYVVAERKVEEAPTAEELFAGFDEDEAYRKFLEENPDKIPILED
jgi:hypothetical protein